MSFGHLPRSASRQALAILRSPDRRSPWVVVLSCQLEYRHPMLDERLRELVAAVPMVGARLDGEVWCPGTPPTVMTETGELTRAPGLLAPFNLAVDPPIRLVADEKRSRFVLAAHHAAFDGRSLVGVVNALVGGELPSVATVPPPGARMPPQRRLARLLSPADRVAPSHPLPTREALAARTFDASGGAVTARLAAACVDAAGARNGALGQRWKNVALSLGVAGPIGVGNVASYRRVDLRHAEAVTEAVASALDDPTEPTELVGTPRVARLLASVAYRFSDSLLVSNLGRIDMEDVARLEFFPVARGRSAVAFGAVGLMGGEAVLTIRARDLSDADAEDLLDAVLKRYRRRV